MAALLAYLVLDADELMQAGADLLLVPAGLMQLDFRTALQTGLREWGCYMFRLLAPFAAIVLAVGLLAEFGQVGFLLVFEKLKPSGAKLNVAKNAKNLVSARNLVETLKASIKIVCFTAVVAPILQASLAPLAQVPHSGLQALAGIAGKMLRELFVACCLLCAAIALLDLAWQRWQRRRRLMMSIDELKREHRESEGRPEVKQQRKRLHRELAQKDVQAVRKASVLVVNPTHVAVALFYETDDTPMPVVLAMGRDADALDMIDVAREAGVPVMRNVPLARALLSTAQLNEYIPGELAVPVAEVLRLVQGLDAAGKREGLLANRDACDRHGIDA